MKKIFLIFLIISFFPFVFAYQFEFYKCDEGICGKTVFINVEIEYIRQIMEGLGCRYTLEPIDVYTKYIITLRNCYFDLGEYNKVKRTLMEKISFQLDEFINLNNKIYEFYLENKIENFLIKIKDNRINYIEIKGEKVDYSKLYLLQERLPFAISANKSKLIGNNKEIFVIIDKGGGIEFYDNYGTTIKIKNLYYSSIKVTLEYYDFWSKKVGKGGEYGFAIEIPKNEIGKFVGIEYNYNNGLINFTYEIGMDRETFFSSGNALDFFTYTRGRLNIKVKKPCLEEKRVESLKADCYLFCSIKTINLCDFGISYFDENINKFVEIIKKKDNLYVCTKCDPFKFKYETENIKIKEKERTIIGKNTKIIYPKKLDEIKIS